MRRIRDFNVFIMCSRCISAYQARARERSAAAHDRDAAADSLQLPSINVSAGEPCGNQRVSSVSPSCVDVGTLMTLTEHLSSQPMGSPASSALQAGRSAPLFTFSRNYKFSAIQ